MIDRKSLRSVREPNPRNRRARRGPAVRRGTGRKRAVRGRLPRGTASPRHQEIPAEGPGHRAIWEPLAVPASSKCWNRSPRVGCTYAKTGRIVIAERSGKKYIIQDAISGRPEPQASKKELKKIKVNTVAPIDSRVTGQLALFSDDPDRRIKAADNLIKNPNPQILPCSARRGTGKPTMRSRPSWKSASPCWSWKRTTRPCAWRPPPPGRNLRSGHPLAAGAPFTDGCRTEP